MTMSVSWEVSSPNDLRFQRYIQKSGRHNFRSWLNGWKFENLQSRTWHFHEIKKLIYCASKTTFSEVTIFGVKVTCPSSKNTVEVRTSLLFSLFSAKFSTLIFCPQLWTRVCLMGQNVCPPENHSWCVGFTTARPIANGPGPVSYHWSLLIPPENIRKPLVFWCFQGVSKEISGMKWVKALQSLLLLRIHTNHLN